MFSLVYKIPLNQKVILQKPKQKKTKNKETNTRIYWGATIILEL